MSKALRIFALTTILLCWSAVLCGASAFRVGDQGSDVAEIQGQLASLGYDVAADGDFGPATAEAVKAFQISRGLDADGLVGPSTYSALLGKSMPEVSRGSSALGRRIAEWLRLLRLCAVCVRERGHLPATHGGCPV